jgi:hypothetical protein
MILLGIILSDVLQSQGNRSSKRLKKFFEKLVQVEEYG